MFAKGKKDRMKIIYFVLLLSSIILFLIFRLPYRQYVYGNNIYDFHFADVAPNFFSVFMFVFFHKFISDEVTNKVICISTFFGLVFYEIYIQQYIYDATLDVLDILASFIGAFLCYKICNRIDNKFAVQI